jgi:hypothetical protein
VLAAGALPHVVMVRLSGLYHAPAASPADRATLVLLWQASQALFDALLIVGLSVVPIGVVALGVAMFRAPGFGPASGRLSVALGVVGLLAAFALLADPLAAAPAFVGFLALIGFHLVMGWKVFRLTRARDPEAAQVGDPGRKAEVSTEVWTCGTD